MTQNKRLWHFFVFQLDTFLIVTDWKMHTLYSLFSFFPLFFFFPSFYFFPLNYLGLLNQRDCFVALLGIYFYLVSAAYTLSMSTSQHKCLSWWPRGQSAQKTLLSSRPGTWKCLFLSVTMAPCLFPCLGSSRSLKHETGYCKWSLSLFSFFVSLENI